MDSDSKEDHRIDARTARRSVAVPYQFSDERKVDGSP
jgi:hypothetical protein